MMKTARELYPDYIEPFYGPGDYGPLLGSIGEIVLQVDDDDYQGDSRILYKDGDKIGYLQFGWGSCSGCDALQGCTHFSEIETLRTELIAAIKWFDTKKDAAKWIGEHDWGGDYSYHHAEQHDFIEKAKSYLTGEAT